MRHTWMGALAFWWAASSGTAHAQVDATQFIGSYLDVRTREILVVDYQANAWRIHYVNSAGKGFDLPVTAVDSAAFDYDPEVMLPRLRVLLAGKPYTLHMHTYEGQAVIAYPGSDPTSAQQQSFAYYTDERLPLAKPIDLVLTHWAGVYRDPQTNELLLLRGQPGAWEFYYSNGQKPFQRLQLLALEAEDYNTIVRFAGSPARYRLHYPAVEMTPWEPLVLNCTGPDGKRQEFSRVRGPVQPDTPVANLPKR